MDLPQTQNTAPVLEFRCLYTQDLRRKQKRWQDGRLKYHTFNKRVMVYDERSNFVGDTHWREDAELVEGDELELERGGVLVEVGDCVGKRDQDLYELLDKRVKEREERVAARVANGPPSQFPNSRVRPQATPDASALLRPKPLNAILTPTSHYGKATISDASPFEERQRFTGVRGNENENNRPAKRQRLNESVPSKSGYAQNLVGATLSLTSSKPSSTPRIRYEPLNITQSLHSNGVAAVDLTMSDDDDVEEARAPTVRWSPSRERDFEGQKSNKQQRKKRKPPAKSGYASNLTGAALTLTRPDKAVLSGPSKRPQLTKEPLKPSPEKPYNLSSSLSDSSFINIDSMGKGPVITEDKLTDRRSKEPKVSRPKPTSHVYSDMLVSKNTAPPPRLHHSIKSGSDQSSSTDRSASGYSMSALRIKSRPPRKMMMLMKRPSARPKRSSGNSENTPSRQRARAKTPPNEPCEPAPFQGSTERENPPEQWVAAQAPQHERLSHPPWEPLPSSPDDDSPLEDIDIDHQTIDALLSKKSNQAMIETAPISNDIAKEKPVPHLGGSRNVTPLNHLTEAPSPKTGSRNARGNSGQREISATIIRRKSLSLAPTSTSSNTPQDGKGPGSPDDVDPGTPLNEEKEMCIEYPKPDGGDRVLKFLLDKPNSQNPTTVTSKLTDVPNPIVNGPQLDGQTKLIPEHAQGPFYTAATDRFRSMLQPSVGSSGKLRDVKAPPSYDTIRIEENSSNIFSSSKDQTLPEAVVEPSPKPPAEIGPQFQDAIEAQVVETESTKPALAPILISKEESLRSGKAKVSNPATRGISLHWLAANTADALVSPLDAISPPAPPQNPTKNEGPQAKHYAEPRSIGLISDRTVGPWSRESFDLFGAWRPPGRHAGTSY